MLAARMLLCREAAPLQRAVQQVLQRTSFSIPASIASSSLVLQKEGPLLGLHVGAHQGCPAFPYSSAAEQQQRAAPAQVELQSPAPEPHDSDVQSLAALKAAADAHMPQGTTIVSTLPILNLNGDSVGAFELPADIFGQEIRRDILQRVVRWQLAKRQQGTHSTKGRGEVRGGGRKPIPQKKTGNARAGSIRSPLLAKESSAAGFEGGAVGGRLSHVTFVNGRLNRVRVQAAKAREGRLIILDSAHIESGKTRDAAAHISVLLANAPRHSILFSDSGKEAHDGGKMLRRSIRNLIWVDALPSQGLNVYSILQRDYLAITVEGAYRLIERLRHPIKR